MNEQQLIERATNFLTRINPSPVVLPLTPIRQTVSELKAAESWDWKHSPGVYYFVDGDAYVRVGRAVPSQGLGNRIGTHIFETDDTEWAAVATNDDTLVGVIPFPPDDWHWAAALEFWLIDVDPRPKFNQKF